MRVTTVLVGGVAAAGIGTAVARRVAARSKREVTHVATVITPPEQVRAAWERGGELSELPGLPARVSPDGAEDAAAQKVPGVRGLSLRVTLEPAPGDRGTEIRVVARGPAARSMDGPLRADLRALKSVLECGEAITVVGQPSGRGRLDSRIQRNLSRKLREGGRG